MPVDAHAHATAKRGQHTGQTVPYSSSLLRPFNHPSRPLNQVLEDPNSGRDFPAVTDVSYDSLPRHCLTEIGRKKYEKNSVSQPSLATGNRPKSGEDRLRAAQAAYNDIMRTITHQRNEEETDRRKSEEEIRGRPRRELLGSRESLIDFTASPDPEIGRRRTERVLSMPKVDIPEIPLEKMKKHRKKEPLEGKRSELSTKAVQSLKTAMRPVQLKHPKISDDLSVSERMLESDSTDRRDGEDDGRRTGNDADKTDNSDESSFSADEEEISSSHDPRYLIEDLWNGYSLKYVKGSVGTPKWSKSTTGTRESFSKQSSGLTEKVVKENGKAKLFSRNNRDLLPKVIVKKHDRKEQNDFIPTKDKLKSNIPMQISAKSDESSPFEARVRTRLSSSMGRLQDLASLEKSEESDDDDGSSSRTWNVHSPASAWTNLDHYDERQIRPKKETQRKPVDPDHSPPTSPKIRPASGTQVPNQAAEVLANKRQRQAAAKLRAKSLERYRAEKLEKEVSDFAEMRNQFRAHPVPAWIKDSKYDQMVEDAVERKRLVQARAARLLEQTVPFNFSEIPDRHSDKRKRLYASLNSPLNGLRRPRRHHTGHEREKATPSALHTFSYTLPRNFCNKHVPSVPPFKPTINTVVPDFVRLHADQDRRLEAYRQQRSWTTVTRPFNLGEYEGKRGIASDSDGKRMISSDFDGKSDARRVQENGEKSTEEKILRRRSKSMHESFDELVRPTRAFSLLAAHSKQKMASDTDSAPRMSLEEQIRAEKLRERLDQRSSHLYGLSSMISQEKSRVPSLVDQNREYQEEITAIKKRLNERPFIWERSQMEDRKKRIDTRFNEILREHNVNGIFPRPSNGS